jgi:hypothetical protein
MSYVLTAVADSIPIDLSPTTRGDAMKRFVLPAAVFFAAVLFAATFTARAQQPKSTNPAKADGFAKIETLVWQHYKALDGFRATDLIAREDVEPLLKKLPAAGLTLKKPDDLLKRLVTKSDFLYVELNTAAGRKFMLQIASYPDGYDRVDRLSRLPRGKQTVRDLIRGPGGQKMIEYMTTAAGGIELGNQLSQSPNGADFNAPTGRIYSVQDLLDYLETQFKAQKR